MFATLTEDRRYSRSCECGTCRKCRAREATDRYNKAHPERVKATRKRTYEKHKGQRRADVLKWQAENPEKTREMKRRYHVKSRFGLSWADYQALLAVRGDVCWICGSDDPKRGRTTMCVDHCHATGRIRGLLCYDCNDGLGRFADDPTACAWLPITSGLT